MKAHYADASWYQLAVLSVLVVGSITGSGLQVTEPALFSLLTIGTIAAHWLGRAIGEKRPDVTHSVAEVKTAPAKGSLPAYVTWLTTVVAFAALGGVFLLSGDVLATIIFALCQAAMFVHRLSAPRTPRGVILRASLTPFMMAGLSILGVFSQVATLHPPTLILGFIPGTILAAAIIAVHAKIFEDAGWTRLTQTAERSRPGSLMRLFSIFILAGPISAFVLVPAKLLPPPLMIGIVPLIWSTKIAKAFSERSFSDEVTYQKTLRLVVLTSCCMLIAGVLSRA